ncbi:MAG: hypothetical protein LBS09_08760 [Bacteroidales bacterium]|jgi:hypothetical protein|nr:hypothetical protein [Bacteroidales bacterium]
MMLRISVNQKPERLFLVTAFSTIAAVLVFSEIAYLLQTFERAVVHINKKG